MKTLTTFIAAAAISLAATGIASADESVADARVQASLSDNHINGQAQSATQHLDVNDSGKSVAASRVEQSLSADAIKGAHMLHVSQSQAFDNASGKSVTATRYEVALNDNV